MEWISIKYRLPNEYETVFCLCKYYIFVGTYLNCYGTPNFIPQEHFKHYVKADATKVTHWMPIPELSKE